MKFFAIVDQIFKRRVKKAFSKVFLGIDDDDDEGVLNQEDDDDDVQGNED
jgi:hypothetical protein